LIRAEAVEAAAKATMPAAWDESAYWPGNTRERFQGLARADALTALEAAAPHIAAEAWDRGFDRGFYDPLAGRDRDASESAASNPYRSQA
jgi:hypothetical protein